MLVPIVFPTGALAVHRYICITGYVSPGMMLTSHVTVKVWEKLVEIVTNLNQQLDFRYRLIMYISYFTEGVCGDDR